jgi:hypothetical protein
VSAVTDLPSGSFELASITLASAADLDEHTLRGWLRTARANDEKGTD